MQLNGIGNIEIVVNGQIGNYRTYPKLANLEKISKSARQYPNFSSSQSI